MNSWIAGLIIYNIVLTGMMFFVFAENVSLRHDLDDLKSILSKWSNSDILRFDINYNRKNKKHVRTSNDPT